MASKQKSKGAAGGDPKGSEHGREHTITVSDDALAALLDLLERGVNRPLELVMLTRERIEGSIEDAVERGRITRRDANDLASELVQRGRRQTEEVLHEVEELVLREVDKARRVAGMGASFPIAGYDDLTARQVVVRIADLEAADLRTVRAYEKKNANRKSVLSALDKALS